jgi:hypothetical protein
MIVVIGAYIALLAFVGVCSVRSSARRHRWPATTLETITSVGWPVLVAAYFWPAVARGLETLALPLFAVSAIWTGYTVWRDFRPSVMKERMPAELPPQQHNAAYAINAAMCAVIVIPVMVIGAVVALRALAPAV